MAGAELGIAAAGAASKVLFSKTSYDFFFKWELDNTLLSALETQVNSAKAVLNDAEMRQIVEGSFVDNWFQRLRYAILDAEDLLDTILTDINMEKYRLGDSPRTSSIIKNKLKYKGKDIVRAIHPNKNTREADMTETIQKLQNIIAQVSHLNVDRNDELTKFRENRITTSSDIHPSKIIGRSENEKEILHLLNSREGNDDAFRVIPIVGMGGVGKTTLASLVYNRYKTSDQSFQVQGWVCVSDKFQVSHVISSLLKSITRVDAKASDDLEFLQKELKRVLQDKRFLLVLDDIWSDVEDKWETLQTIFSIGAPGSRIIVTTREEKVADIVSNSRKSSYELNGLSDAEGWSLFQSHAFENGDSNAYPVLEKIGREIVGKCKGSPLAIKMLGRVLFSKKNDEREWKLVLNSKIWNSTNKILPSLWLSYYHLPLPVKQCFAYLSIFPKDYTFSMKKTVKLWVAEGFVEKPRETNSRGFDYEHVGRTYFDDLCSNFFIQKSMSNPSKFVIHDLVHDLAEYVSKDLMVNQTDINPGARRLSNTNDTEILLSKRSIQNLSRLRTFLLGKFDYRYASLFNDKICKDLLSNFKLLRVLSLEGSVISVLPASVGDMKLLRYLNLSYTQIECLPQWISGLHNLQILKLLFCEKLKRLPASLCGLVNLRELNVEGTQLIMMPYGIGGMTSLRKLPDFVLGEGNSKQMNEFENLYNLHGKLHISGLSNIVDIKDVAKASFGNKEYLEELILEWDPNREGYTILEERVLDAMEPHKNLKQLTIDSYGGKSLPNWIVGVAPSFRSTVFLSITNCFNCDALPSIGAMPFLEQLIIENLDSLESLGAEFYGDTGNPFPALQKLVIRHMKVLKTWCFARGGKIGFSSLKELRIQNCGQLTEIPCCFPSLTTFHISQCGNLSRLAFVGNFPFLKNIIIDELDCLESLGLDIYGDGYNPFPALEELRISNLKVLKTWCFARGGKIGFSSLKELRIENCGQLTEIPCCFPSLTTFKIRYCGNLRRLAFVGNFPFLKDIHIEHLDCLESLGPDFYGDVCSPFPALKNLRITHMKVLKQWCFPGGDSVGLSSLKELIIEYCPELTEIPYCFPRLIELQIVSCPNLVRLEMKEKGSESSSTIDGHSLQCISIMGCDKLEEIPKSFVNLAKVTIHRCMSLVSVPVLQHLHNLSIRDVSALLPLEAAIQNCVLKQLFIDSPSCTVIVKLLSEKKTRFLHGFSSLKDDDDSRVKQPPNLSELYTEGGLYRNNFTQVFNLNFLTELKIISCDDDLEPFLAESPSELRSLTIIQCNSLRTIPNRFLSGCSKHLVDLRLNNCPNLACLPDVLSALESLQNLWLESCPLIQHFPASSGFLFKRLCYLHIINCPTLESLPDGFHNITTLQHLYIKECPDLVVPEDGFPAMITGLFINNCGKMDPVSKLKLSKLTSLTNLHLQGFPKTIALDHCIPESILDLRITDFPHLKSISGVLLKRTTFVDCPLLNQNKSWSTKLKGICTSGFPSTDQSQ